MNTDVINTAFAKLLSEKLVGPKIGIKYNHAAQLRYNIRNGRGISMDTKLRLLQKSGWRQDDKVYSQKDLVEAVRFVIKQGIEAKAQDAEYLVEKWMRSLLTTPYSPLP